MSDHNASFTLLELIDQAFDADLEPVPADLTAAARDAFAFRNVDGQLAELLFDSASDELVGVRGTTTERRSFRFGAGDSVLRVHLTNETMIIMIEPPLSVGCRVVTHDGVVNERTDELGELALDAPELPMRLEVELPSGAIVTPWITG